ncbi:hypothetical protein Tco_0418070 [Tanacetum coccineum]
MKKDPSDGNSESAVDTVVGTFFVISVDGMTGIILHGALKVDGPSWAVGLGRRVSTDSSATQAVEDIPRGSDNPTQLIASFDK